MDALSSGQMVELWEKGRTRADHERAIDILSIARPELSHEALTIMPLGARNRALFELRKRAVANTLRAFVQCPKCSEPLEFEQSIDELLVGAEPEAECKQHQLKESGYTVQFRLPNSADQAAAAELFFEEEVAEHLLDATILGVEHQGERLPAAGLPENLRAQIRSEQTRLDPLANPTVFLGCAQCKHTWQAPIDIAAYFWVEIERQARTVIDDVVMLARGYGWREEDILKMGESRRELYLEALGGA